MSPPSPKPDAALLAGSLAEPELFGVFYDRHVAALTAYVVSIVDDRETAADLVAEVFAAALTHRSRYKPLHETALPWLLTIARRKAIDHGRRLRSADAARRSLRLATPTFTEDDHTELDNLSISGAAALSEALKALDPATRTLVTARIVDERPYHELARELGCSEQTIRKRVSRGLARVRSVLEST